MSLPLKGTIQCTHLGAEMSVSAGDASAPSPNWERALCVSEPQASLRKEGEGSDGPLPAPRSPKLSAPGPSPFAPKAHLRFAKARSPLPHGERGRSRLRRRPTFEGNMGESDSLPRGLAPSLRRGGRTIGYRRQFGRHRLVHRFEQVFSRLAGSTDFIAVITVVGRFPIGHKALLPGKIGLLTKFDIRLAEKIRKTSPCAEVSV